MQLRVSVMIIIRFINISLFWYLSVTSPELILPYFSITNFFAIQQNDD